MADSTFTNYLETKILDHVFGKTTFTAESGCHIALSTTTPIDDGTNFTEPAANSGYHRVSVDNDKTTWSAASSGDNCTVENNIAVTFPQATGGGWGMVTYFGIYDTYVGGYPLGFGLLTSPRSITDGDTPQFASGDLDITLD